MIPPSTFATESADHHRDRLLDTLAQRRGAADRCALWSAMTIVEKGIFLTHTDLLGHRSCFRNASVAVANLDGMTCTAASCNCSTSGPCRCAAGAEQALDHVFKLWAVDGTDTACCTGTNCCNGGAEWHRTFFSADDALIADLRNVSAGLPEWAESNDFAGPHAPFTQSSETRQGGPRGQTHFWSADGDATVLQRNGVVGVSDPHVVELANDYDLVHDASPEGVYTTVYGRAAYKAAWNGTTVASNRGDGLATTFAGNGALSVPELAGDAVWSPSCGPVIDPGGVTPETGGNPSALRLGMRIAIAGTGFAASGNRIHLRTRSIAIVLDASSALVVSESARAIVLRVPPDIGQGEGFVYVESGGTLSNLQAVTFLP